MQFVTDTLARVAEVLYPSVCLQCDKNGENGIDLCSVCLQSLSWNYRNCKRCALPLVSGTSPMCGACSNRALYFDYAYAPFIYKNFVQEAITRLKYSQKLNYGKLLADLFCKKIEKEDLEIPDIIVPVPLHKNKIKQRGFNQSLELARIIGKYFDIAVYKNSVNRVRDTESQMKLPAKQRAANVKNAFELNQKYVFKNKNVVVLDDVMTTGNTVNEVAKYLGKADANEIAVWVIARAS